MPANEVALYQALYALEPWGSEAEDVRCAIVASTTARAAGSKVKIKDFVPKWYDPSDGDDWGATLAGFKAFAATQSKPAPKP